MSTKLMKADKIAASGHIDFYSVNTESAFYLPMADGGIAAGFPSPAQDYIDIKIDLNRELIANLPAPFLAG